MPCFRGLTSIFRPLAPLDFTDGSTGLWAPCDFYRCVYSDQNDSVDGSQLDWVQRPVEVKTTCAAGWME